MASTSKQLAGTGLLLLGFAAGAVTHASWTNLAVVEEGALYRSAQLRPGQLADVVDELGIRTIVNLRGAKPDRRWYREQRAVANAKGVAHLDVRWSADRLPHRASLLDLLEVYRTAERPILVHCFSGADRAGEAAAIYQMEHMGRSADQAVDMLSPRFLHLAWLRPAKHYFLGFYRGGRWARAEYDPCGADYRYYDKDKYCAPGGPGRRGQGSRVRL